MSVFGGSSFEGDMSAIEGACSAEGSASAGGMSADGVITSETDMPVGRESCSRGETWVTDILWLGCSPSDSGMSAGESSSSDAGMS